VWMTVWYAGSVIHTQCQIPSVKQIKLSLLVMGTQLPETCREKN